MDKEQVLDDLCMYANHDTQYKNMEKAYDAGVKAERLRITALIEKQAENMRLNGCKHEASAVECLLDDLTD